MRRVRRETGVSLALGVLQLEGIDEEEAYYRFVNGLDSKGKRVGKNKYLQRGEAMREIVSEWLSRW